MRREITIHAALLLAVLALAFPRVFLSGEFAVASTLLGQSAPWDAVFGDELRPKLNPLTIETVMAFHADFVLAKRQLAAGEWPLWNPLQFAGKPLLANYQSTVFYPPRLLHAIFSVPIATTLYVLLKLWLCGMTAYLYGRVAGLGVGASRFLSVAWMMGGFVFTWAYWTPTDVAAWFPVVLIGVEFLARGALRRGFAALFVGATLMLLAGHPETTFVYGLGSGLYFLLRLATERTRPRLAAGAAATALGAWGIALGVCAVQILPFAEYAAVSNNVAIREGAAEARHAVPLSDWVSFLVPRYYGTNVEENFRGAQPNSTFNSTMYPGIAVWIGVLLAFGILKSLDRRRVLSWAAPTVLFGIAAFEIGGIQRVLDFPVLSSLWQCYFLGVALFGAAVIAAMSLDAWSSEPRTIRTLYPVLGGLALLGIAAIPKIAFDWGLVQSDAGTAYFSRQLGIAAMLAGFALFVLYLGIGRAPRRITLTAFTVLLFVDLMVAGRDLLPTTPRSQHFPETALTDALRALPPHARVDAVSKSGIRPGLMTPYGVEEHWGYDGILPARMIELYAHLGDPEKAQRLAGVTHRVVPADAEEDALTIEGLPDALPRAYVAYDWAAASGKDATFARLLGADFDPTRSIVLDQPIAWVPAPMRIAPATVDSRTATSLVVQVEAARPGILVLLDAYFPGWTATVDGEPAVIMPVNHAFRGVPVLEGRHEVVFEYAPRSFRSGLRLSIATLAFALVAGLYGFRFAA